MKKHIFIFGALIFFLAANVCFAEGEYEDEEQFDINIKPIPAEMKFEKGTIKLGDDIAKAYEVLGPPTIIGQGGTDYVWRYGRLDLYAPAVIIKTVGGKKIHSIATDRWAAATTPEDVGPGVERRMVVENYGKGFRHFDYMRTGYYEGKILVIAYGYTDDRKAAKQGTPRMRVEIAVEEDRVMYLLIADGKR